MKWSKQKPLLPFVLGAFLSFTSVFHCFADETNLQKVTFLAHWTPQAQFAGFYVAAAKGFYKQHGLDVQILQSGPDVSPEKNLADNKADFITRFLAVAIEDRQKAGLPLVNICQIVQHSAVMLITKKTSGISRIEDLAGKRIYAWPDTQLSAFLRKNNISATVIPKGDSNALFLEGGVDAMSAMWYNEYHSLYINGIETNELNTFFLRDYGLNFPEDGIYCLQSTLKEKPAVCKAFVEASMEGWRYAMTNHEDTLKIVMDKVRAGNAVTCPAHQRWMLSRMKDIIDPENIRMGTLSSNDYATVVSELISAGVITNATPMKEFHVDVTKPE